jgi:hypothetical protein
MRSTKLGLAWLGLAWLGFAGLGLAWLGTHNWFIVLTGLLAVTALYGNVDLGLPFECKGAFDMNQLMHSWIYGVRSAKLGSAWLGLAWLGLTHIIGWWSCAL